MNTWEEQARHFLANEKEFMLGALPTEQSNPKTTGFSAAVTHDTGEGIRVLQRVDRDIGETVGGLFGAPEFARLTQAMTDALEAGRRIFFSGCGATGRLSILLEAMYRRFWIENEAVGSTDASLRLRDSVRSIMTGGDFALVRSVENFEDYASFGRQQTIDAGVGDGDLFVAISEGGETSSVIGSAWGALEAGARVFFVCNNPADVLAECVVRSREIIEDSRITNIHLVSGPMAIAGSTRMQATTYELLYVGAALESAMARLLDRLGIKPDAAGSPEADDYPTIFNQLLEDLEKDGAVRVMADYTEMEQAIYESRGLVTYMGDRFLLDIFTDTTERSPTFKLPPFRKHDDENAPRSWAFVNHPLYPTREAWPHVLAREPRCLEWNGGTYRRLGAAESICANPPGISRRDLDKILIGNEVDPERAATTANAAVLVMAGAEAGCAGAPGSPLMRAFAGCAAPFAQRASLYVGPDEFRPDEVENHFNIHCRLPASPIRLWDHLAIKLALNTISTAAMGRMGRVMGNWMVHVEPTNKKLIDRGSRLIAELGGVDYERACRLLHRTIEETAALPPTERAVASPVAIAIARLKSEHQGPAQ